MNIEWNETHKCAEINELACKRTNKQTNERINLWTGKQELRIAFDKDKQEHPSAQKLLLSVAVPAGQDNIDTGFDVPTISR